ncbi:MAG: hypothetical protein ACRCYY_13620 [Trueperaceae bacterium]
MTHFRLSLKHVVLTVITVLSLTSCSAPLSSDEAQAKKEVLALAPVGSDVTLAKPTLEKLGFKCSWTEQGTFAGSEGEQDYLYCDDIEKTVGFFVLRRWQIALVHQNNVVKDASVTTGLIGL